MPAKQREKIEEVVKEMVEKVAREVVCMMNSAAPTTPGESVLSDR